MTRITNKPIDFDALKILLLEGEEPGVPSSAYDSVISLFEDKAFRENPYKFVLEDLLDNYISLPVIKFNMHKLIKNLPDFEKKCSLNLLEEIAQERFNKETDYEKIMGVFKRSLNFDEFQMRFEYGMRHLKISHLGFSIQNIFHNARQLKLYSYREMDIHLCLYDEW